MPSEGEPHLRSEQGFRGGRRIVIATLLLACLGSVAIEVPWPLAGDPHAERPRALDFPGSYALYGFTGCVLLVMLGRLLRLFVMRPESYWSDRR